MFEPTMSALQFDEVVRMKLSCRDSAQFLTEFAPKMASRIFVPMEAPLSAGSIITLHIRFQDGEVHVKGKAEVIKAVILPRAGVHVRFSKLDADSLQFSLTRTSATQAAFVPRTDELSNSSEAYIPPMTVDPSTGLGPGAAGAPIPLPGASSALPLPPPKPSSPRAVSSLLSDAPPPRPSSPAFVPFVPKPASSLLAPLPPRPSSPKPVSSLLSDAPPPRPSSPAFVPFVPKPASSLSSGAPPPQPSSPSIAKPDAAPAPKPVSSLLSDAPPPGTALKAAPDPFAFLGPAAATPQGGEVTKVPAPSARPSSPSISKSADPAPAPPPAAKPSSPSLLESDDPAPAPPPAEKPSSPSALRSAPLRDARPLDGPASSPPRPRDKRPLEEKPRLPPQRISPPREEGEEAPRSSRLPLLIGVGIVVLGLVSSALYVGLNGGAPKPTKAAVQSQAVLDLLKKMDEQMMEGRYAGPGGDTALDSLRIAVATAPENPRVKEYQEKLVSFFERRVAEAIATSDHAEAAVQLIALRLADPKRDGVAERLKAEEDQVKNQAARPAPK